MCHGAVHWAALPDEDKAAVADLPDPYEPLLLMFEHGSGYLIEEFIDLYGVMIPYGTFVSNRDTEPLLTLTPSSLDTLDKDATGRITYYAKINARPNGTGTYRRSPAKPSHSTSHLGVHRTALLRGDSSVRLPHSRPRLQAPTRATLTISAHTFAAFVDALKKRGDEMH
jgi:hypothetical protein